MNFFEGEYFEPIMPYNFLSAECMVCGAKFEGPVELGLAINHMEECNGCKALS